MQATRLIAEGTRFWDLRPSSLAPPTVLISFSHARAAWFPYSRASAQGKTITCVALSVKNATNRHRAGRKQVNFAFTHDSRMRLMFPNFSRPASGGGPPHPRGFRGGGFVGLTLSQGRLSALPCPLDHPIEAIRCFFIASNLRAAQTSDLAVSTARTSSCPAHVLRMFVLFMKLKQRIAG
jgi:hypothetical protein